MCLLSFYEPGTQPDLSRLDRGCEYNNDGFGYAIVAGSRLIVNHGMSADKMVDKFAEERKRHPGGPAIFHSRLATGGTVDTYNCHPFYVAGDRRTVIAHNGVMFMPPQGSRRSDTRIFAEDMFPKRYFRLDKPSVQRQLVKYLGRGNKLAILTVNPRYKSRSYLVNSGQGTWVAPGEWQSNDSWKWGWGVGKSITTAGTGLLGGINDAWHWSDTDSGWVPPWSDCDELCVVCGNLVSPAVLYCTKCRSCVECGMEDGDCLCYVPDALKLDVATRQVEEWPTIIGGKSKR